jgi:hypothetical protein
VTQKQRSDRGHQPGRSGIRTSHQQIDRLDWVARFLRWAVSKLGRRLRPGRYFSNSPRATRDQDFCHKSPAQALQISASLHPHTAPPRTGHGERGARAGRRRERRGQRGRQAEAEPGGAGAEAGAGAGREAERRQGRATHPKDRRCYISQRPGPPQWTIHALTTNNGR